LSQVESYIAELLKDHDCVIIPGLGAFVANPEPAKIDTRQHLFSPPYKEIGFNKNIVRNDGLLADKIAEKERIPYEQANSIIGVFVKDCIGRLQNGERISFKDVGIVSIDSSRNIQFESETSVNFLPESFGLDSFHSPAIKRQSFEQKVEQEIIDRSPIPIDTSTTPGKGRVIPIKIYYRAAASILLIAAISWLYLNIDLIKGLEINYSDLNPFARSDSGTYVQRIDKTLEKEPETDVADPIQEWLDNIAEENVDPIPKVKEVKVIRRFHIIGGCFEFKSNADRLLKKLKHFGFDAALVGKNRRGLHRVAYGSYETRAEARRELRIIKKNNLRSAWLYVGRK